MDLGLHTSRRGVAGVLAAILIFGLLFTAGFAYITWQAQSNQNQNAANLNRQNAVVQGNLEHLYLATIVSGTGPYTVTAVVENSGGIATTIVGAYASIGGVLIKSPGIVTENTALAIGGSVSLTLAGISVASGTVSVITSRGNTFSAPFPNPPTQSTTTISTSTGSTSTTSTVPGLAGSNALVVQMVATPPVAFGCHNGCELVTVTVYNYALFPIEKVQLSPSVPTPSSCGNAPGCTASLSATAGTCAGPYPPGGGAVVLNNITAYSGSGAAPYIYYLCTYNVVTGNVGGYASFSGLATGKEIFSASNKVVVASAEAISNTIQIGGSANVLGQGPFSVNFFVFKYSSCYPNGPSSSHGSYSYAAPCASTPARIPPNLLRELGNASLISAGSNYYVAFYFQITNDYNAILPILKYSFVQTESSGNLGEADLYIVGGPSNSSTIYPNYCQAGGGPPACGSNNLPVFNAYTATATSCAETGGEPPASTCINVSPGKSVVLTFAACGPGSPSWEWGGSQYGNSWDPGYSGCATVNLGIGSHGSPTALILVLSYLLNNVVYTEDVAFQSVSFTP